MTIVIPYRDEVHKGLELKYALRSIEKYLSGWDEIIIVGDFFPAMKFGVREVKNSSKLKDVVAIDKPAQKNFNIYNKVLEAIKYCDLTDNFIMWHDDHFLLQPLNVNEIKYWHNGRLQKELQQIVNGEVRRASGRYRKAIEHTLEIAPLTLNWDIHVPIIFNKEKFKATFAGRQDELCVKSFYCYTNAADGIVANTEFMEDLKIPFQMPYERLKEKIKDRLFFSIDSAAIGEDLIRVWNEYYPEPSKFELV